jgi:hypothetical protein
LATKLSSCGWKVTVYVSTTRESCTLLCASGAVVRSIGVYGVLTNPIKQGKGSQFLMQECQRLLLPQHIGLFDAGGYVLGGDPSLLAISFESVWQVGTTGRGQYITPDGNTVKGNLLVRDKA